MPRVPGEEVSPAPPPRPQPRRDDPEHPAERGAPGPAPSRGPARPAPGKGAPPPARPPAGKAPPPGKAPAGKNQNPNLPPLPPTASNVARAGKFFEVRKGAGRSEGGEEEIDDDDRLGEISLPRSITQEQEEADLKRRLNRDELLDVDKRHSAVKMVGVASGPSPLRRRSSGVWVIVVVLLAMVLLFVADKYKLLNLGSHAPTPQK